MRRTLGILLLIIAGAQPAIAAEIRSIELQHEDGHYSMESVAWFDAGLDATFEVFSSWDLSTEFSKAIVEARDLEPDDSGREGYFIINRGCILFFCKSLTRQGYVERQPSRVMHATANPEFSDFHLFEESWEFTEIDGGTSVRYVLEMEPDFWVPPAIGPYMIKRKLKKDGGNALDRIEAFAQAVAEAPGH